jgi:hypothetical protein
MEVVNTLAYYYIATITAVKLFIVQAPVSNLARKKSNFSCPYFKNPLSKILHFSVVS